MVRVNVAGDRLSWALDLAKSRNELFKNDNYQAHLTGALGELGTCGWLEENGITPELDFRAAFNVKEEQGEADILVADKALRIEVKSNDKGNRRYRVKESDEKKIKSKADVVLWCEVEPIGVDGDIVDHEPVLIHAADVTVLGWATVDEAFLAELDEDYRFMEPRRVRPLDALLEQIRAALAARESQPVTPVAAVDVPPS